MAPGISAKKDNVEVVDYFYLCRIPTERRYQLAFQLIQP